MGDDVEARTFTRADRTRYRQKVRHSLDVFARMLREARFDTTRQTIGCEIELNLAQVPTTGSGFFPSSMNPPDPICNRTGISFVPSYTSGKDSPLWGVQPVIGGDHDLCVGQEVDSGNNLSEGWICLAAVAADPLGNRGVSPPLRLCLC